MQNYLSAYHRVPFIFSHRVSTRECKERGWRDLRPDFRKSSATCLFFHLGHFSHFLRCAFSNISSNCLHERMLSRIDNIWSTFLWCGFSNVFWNEQLDRDCQNFRHIFQHFHPFPWSIFLLKNWFHHHIYFVVVVKFVIAKDIVGKDSRNGKWKSFTLKQSRGSKRFVWWVESYLWAPCVPQLKVESLFTAGTCLYTWLWQQTCQ